MSSLVFYIFIDATIYVGGLDDKVTESLMWELFVQSGPVGKFKRVDSFIRCYYLG